MSDGRKMSGRTVVLAGGPPWGFRMTAASDGVNSLKISRVNPGSVSAEKVREGDIITSINGQETSILTVQQAQAVLNCENKELTLVLLHAGISCPLSTDDITNPSGDKHSLFIDV